MLAHNRVCLPSRSTASPCRAVVHHQYQRRTSAHAAPSDDKQPSSSGSGATAETSAGLKAVWYAAEGLGKVVGMTSAKSGSSAEPSTSSAAPRTGRMGWEQLVAAIKDDYSQDYFVSGKGSMEAYADDCEFADPFVAFKGKGRFQQNVGNLGGMMRDIKLDVYDFQEKPEQNQVLTKWRFSCTLALPWRPLLAAAGGTTHVIDPSSGLVVRHVEMWDVEPSKVVAQLFKPAVKVPTSAAETFFLSASDGDFQGMWLAVSPLAFKLCGPVVGVSLLCKAFAGEGLPGATLGTIEGVAWLGFVSACVTEVWKLCGSFFQGGETGTGGRF